MNLVQNLGVPYLTAYVSVAMNYEFNPLSFGISEMLKEYWHKVKPC